MSTIIGTGVDITEVRRLRQAVEKWGDSFLERIFTSAEIENAKKRVTIYQHLAGRFAAKEAIFKAVGDQRLTWKDMEVLNDPDGKPYCRLLSRRYDKFTVFISISHVKNYAVANAIVTQEKK
ncbi:MAG: holo-ACP synthase [Candidatus Omnitrophica bacterium]|nr:holo-ACP synthase [Candidatus Omnitrophota bacterium]